MSGLLVGIWLRIPENFRRITDTYFVFGALLVYPLISVPQACELVVAEYGMTYITTPYVGRKIYNIYLLFFFNIYNCRIGILSYKKREKKRDNYG